VGAIHESAAATPANNAAHAAAIFNALYKRFIPKHPWANALHN
jgi:hypothetical protein